MGQRTISIQTSIDEINKRLKSYLPQAEKKFLCSVAENMLMACDDYRGFNYLYWLEHGNVEWTNAGRPEGEDKKKFMYGHEYMKLSTDRRENHSSTLQGEFSRVYF